jgi:lycopene cyclase domain-containing protein
MTLTYIQFHALLIVPVLSILGVAAARPRVRTVVPSGPSLWVGVGVVELLALVYTIPWDNYLISMDVWSYGSGRVLLTIWNAPLEEYLFIALQPLVVALWFYQIRPAVERVQVSRVDRLVGVGAGASVGLAGAAMLTLPATFYLGAILTWSSPVLALQWGVGWPYLWAKRRALAVAVLVPTTYLCLVDRLALAMGIWTISPRYTTGLTVLGLPVEEATFFLLTTLFVVQGLVLYDWVIDRWL